MSDDDVIERADAAYCEVIGEYLRNGTTTTIKEARIAAMTAALEALSRDRAGEQKVVVKPLEWLSDKEPLFAYTPFCSYHISPVDDDTGPHWATNISQQGSIYKRSDTAAEAKAAAEADHERRILSALASPVSPAPDDNAGEQNVIGWRVSDPTTGQWTLTTKADHASDFPYWKNEPLYTHPVSPDVRRMALEEAAELAEDTSSSIGPVIAKAIRSLANTPPRSATASDAADTVAPATLARDADSEATPAMIAAAWRAWHERQGGKLGPGPAFKEAITAALRASSEKEPKT